MREILTESGQTRALTSLVEEEQKWREKVRSFAENRIRPLVKRMDEEGAVSRELLQALFAEGLMGIEIPKLYGGVSGDLFRTVIAIEEVARIDPGVAVYVDVQNALVINAIRRWGTGDQKRRYLPRLAKTMVGAYALSERGSGSDAFALATMAEPDGKDYVLEGRKHWTSGAAEADLFLVFAKVRGKEKSRITAFLVERSTPGVSVSASIDKMGIRASSTCQLMLEKVRVRRENVIGNPGDGDRLAADTLNIGRVGIASQMVGLAQGALEAALDYAQRREQFGRKISSFQGVQFSLDGLPCRQYQIPQVG